MDSLANIIILGMKLVFECCAFIKFQLSGVAVEEFKDISQALEVLFNTSTQDDYTVKIDEKNLPLEPPEDQFHGSLECTRCVAGAKRHPGLFVETIAGTESCFVTIFRVHSTRQDTHLL